MASGSPRLLGVAGWKGSGKTTLIEKLLPLLRRGGLTVATVKNTHHPLREHDGLTDGERHAKAGAGRTAVLAPDTWELDGVPQSTPPPSLEAVIALFGPADLILVEGFKSAAIPKIEVRSSDTRNRPSLAAGDPLVIAIAAGDMTARARASASRHSPATTPRASRRSFSPTCASRPYLREPSRSKAGTCPRRRPDFQRRRT